MTMDATERVIASAVAEAMRQPRVEATAYSDVDRRVLLTEALGLRRRADRLDALVVADQEVTGE